MIEAAIERPGGAAGLAGPTGMAGPRPESAGLESAGRVLAARFGGGAAAVPGAGGAAVAGARGAAGAGGWPVATAAPAASAVPEGRATAPSAGATAGDGEAVSVAGKVSAPGPAAPAVPGGSAAEAAAPGEWVRWAETLTAALPAPAAFAVLEHLFGVMPLLAACFAPAAALAAAAAGRRLGALGLFTPAPELSWHAAAVAAEPDGGGGLRLHGLVRIPFAGADAVLLPARLPGGELRLVWLEDGAGVAGVAGGATDVAAHSVGLPGAGGGRSAGAAIAAVGADGAGIAGTAGGGVGIATTEGNGAALPGVERRGERGGGAVRAGAPCWIAMDGVAVGPEAVSRPVTLGPGGDAGRILESYARVWGLAASITAGAAVTALRRAARTTAHGGRAWSASQLVAMDLAELEIEAELAGVALRAAPAPATPAVGGGAGAAGAAGRTGARDAAAEHAGAEDTSPTDASPRDAAVGDASPGDAAAGDATASVGAFALAAVAARILAAVAAKTAELRDAGLAPEGPLAGDGAARCLTAFLGGALRLESEAAGALGLRDLEAAAEGGA